MNIKVNTISLLFLFLFVTSCKKKTAPAVSNLYTHGEFADEKLKVGNDTRAYRLFVPESVNLNEPAPLVIAFHGLGIDSKDVMPGYTLLNETANKNSFILVYPQSLGGSWAIDLQKTADDINFYDKLIEMLSNRLKIDSKRIFVLGMSNGGYFAHLVAKERSDKITAMASHSGPLGLQTLAGINAARKLPAMILHGENDKLFDISIAKENFDKYTKEGHEAKYMPMKNIGHEWGTVYHVNDSIWNFFNKFRLP